MVPGRKQLWRSRAWEEPRAPTSSWTVRTVGDSMGDIFEFSHCWFPSSFFPFHLGTLANLTWIQMFAL